MASYVTQIEKHRFVCGLFWQSLSRPRDLKKEAIDLGRKIDSDLLVIRMDHSTAQAGFAHSREGGRCGMFSLAAIVSKTLAIEGAFYDGEQQAVHNWLGVFMLPDGKWLYLAVRDANFLPNGDFVGEKEEVLDRLHSDYALGGWNVVIGEPELVDMGFHNFSARTIATLIPRKKDGSIRVHKWWRLYQIDGVPSWLPTVAGAAAALLVAAGGWLGWRYYQQKQAEQENEQAIARAREQIQREAQAAAHPWSHIPLPAVMVKTCMHQFDHLTAGGWQLESYLCTPERQSYSWQRGDSTIALLRAQVPDAIVDASGDKASYVHPLSMASGDNDVLGEAQPTLEGLISRFQAIGLPIKVSAVAPLKLQAQPQPQQPQQQQWQPEWRSFLFSINAHGMAPTDIAAMLSRPGVRVEKLVYHGAEWSLEGTIYAK